MLQRIKSTLMEVHYQFTDHEFETQFADNSLNPSVFTHEAHLRLAKIHISKYGVDEAIIRLCSQIKNFAAFNGDHNKFNTTLTVAAIKAVDHFIKRTSSNDFKELIKKFPRLKTNFRGLMNAHYSFDIFNDSKAKKEFIEPDLLPFE